MAIVTSADFSPDGQTVASVAVDGLVRIWDASTGAEIAKFTGDQDGMLSIRFSPTGRTLLTVGSDGGVRLWGIKGGPALAELIGHRGKALQANFVPESDMIVSAGEDGTIRLWRPAATRALAADLNSISLGPGQAIAGGSDAGPVTVVDFERGTSRVLGKFEKPAAARFAADGSVVGASLDGTVQLWGPSPSAHDECRPTTRRSGPLRLTAGRAKWRSGTMLAVSLSGGPTARDGSCFVVTVNPCMTSTSTTTEAN